MVGSIYGPNRRPLAWEAGEYSPEKELVTVPKLTELCLHRGANTIPLI